MDYYGFDSSLIADIKPTFSEQDVSMLLQPRAGSEEGTPITYRAGDQPNNALSLNVFNPGEIASTAGTSGVVYGVNGEVNYDPKSRVNTFAHVNHAAGQTRLGVLLCINGTGILNSWVKRTVAPRRHLLQRYESAGGASSHRQCRYQYPALWKRCGAYAGEQNRLLHSWHQLQPARQTAYHPCSAGRHRFSFKYGIDIMEQMGIPVQKIHAGKANMFLSPLFRETLAGVTGAVIELYDTDGSVGAAKGAGIGAGHIQGTTKHLPRLRSSRFEPKVADRQAYADAYARWKHWVMC